MERKTNIGFITDWYERGGPYVMKAIRDSLSRNYNTFIFAYTSALYGGSYLKQEGEWDVSNLTIYNEPQIPPSFFEEWAKKNFIDIVFFGNIHDFCLLELAKKLGIKVVGIVYWEFFNPALIHKYNLFDRIICPIRASYEKLKVCGLKNVEFIRWGVDLNLFKPLDKVENSKVRFFHPAGWGGLYERRGTMFVIDAFNKLNDPGIELLIHAQFASKNREAGNIRVTSGVVSRDELIKMYQNSDIAVLPSKWEGLGLTFLEAIACGLPIITVDAPPMNEYVKDGYNGFCCKIKERVKYPDVFVEGVHVDIEDMAEKMIGFVDRRLLSSMKKRTNEVRGHWNWRERSALISDMTEKL